MQGCKANLFLFGFVKFTTTPLPPKLPLCGCLPPISYTPVVGSGDAFIVWGLEEGCTSTGNVLIAIRMSEDDKQQLLPTFKYHIPGIIFYTQNTIKKEF